MSLLERITIDNDICHGKPCVRHMRWPVEAVLDLMSAGMSPAEIRADHPELEVEDLNACLQYVWPAESGDPKVRPRVAPDLSA
jgi:uncharacterized protein (DUF433 family)